MKNITIPGKVKTAGKIVGLVALVLVGYFGGNAVVKVVHDGLDSYSLNRVSSRDDLKSRFVQANTKTVTQYVVTKEDAQANQDAVKATVQTELHNALK